MTEMETWLSQIRNTPEAKRDEMDEDSVMGDATEDQGEDVDEAGTEGPAARSNKRQRTSSSPTPLPRVACRMGNAGRKIAGRSVSVRAAAETETLPPYEPAAKTKQEMLDAIMVALMQYKSSGTSSDPAEPLTDNEKRKAMAMLDDPECALKDFIEKIFDAPRTLENAHAQAHEVRAYEVRSAKIARTQRTELSEETAPANAGTRVGGEVCGQPTPRDPREQRGASIATSSRTMASTRKQEEATAPLGPTQSENMDVDAPDERMPPPANARATLVVRPGSQTTRGAQPQQATAGTPRGTGGIYDSAHAPLTEQASYATSKT
ncbi:hypothetical protein C8Q79DRAFT_1006841 [Trametes meyenii]|nr:hypothetical protein C8Q79DRAFT_1006841 [Trametes meyenii]